MRTSSTGAGRRSRAPAPGETGGADPGGTGGGKGRPGAGGPRASGRPAPRAGGRGGADQDHADPDAAQRDADQGGVGRDHADQEHADPEEVARLICLRLLTEAPRTRAQLARALAARGVPEVAATAVLERFTDVGLVDDAAFAAAWVTTRQRGRGLAPRALAAELRRRGVATDVVHDAVGRISRDDEVSAARALVARRLPMTVGLPAPARLRRLSGMLARRGYPADVVATVVRAALEAEKACSGDAAGHDP